MLAEDRLAAAVRRIIEDVSAQNSIAVRVRAGGFSLLVCFRSQALADAVGAAFLPGGGDSGGGKVDLTITFATADETDLSHLIPAGMEQSDFLASDEYFLASFFGELPVLYGLDRHSGRGFVWLPGNKAPHWELSRPALPLLHAFAIDSAWTAVHGGAIGREGRFLLLGGLGKSGKTTASLACARAGWRYAGDDYVFVDSTSGRIEPLYRSARLRLDMADNFSDLLRMSTALSRENHEMRHELRLTGPIAERIAGGNLAAILLPRRRGAVLPTFEPARRVDAYAAFAAVTGAKLPGWPKRTAEKLMAMIGLAPVYFVDTGSSPDAIADAFMDFLDRL
jgi:hypothetical protein